MIAGIFHEGSGLGDQLFRYITIRTLAEEKGYDWAMKNAFSFKGKEMFNEIEYSAISLGYLQKIGSPYDLHFDELKPFNEKIVRDENGVDIRSYDPEINFVQDNTLLDGSFEDSKYWAHNLENINKWLAVEPLEVPDDLCVIGFRGGEYYADKDLGLPKEYFDKAIAKMGEINPNMRFQVHTEDPVLAKQFFPDFEIVDNTIISHSKHSNMAFNWRSARYAKYAIIPNSAFFILPRLLKHLEDPEAITIAPRGWSRRNLAKGKNAGDFLWARPSCYYPQFLYI